MILTKHEFLKIYNELTTLPLHIQDNAYQIYVENYGGFDFDKFIKSYNNKIKYKEWN